jgi:UbiD family decarboxylase
MLGFPNLSSFIQELRKNKEIVDVTLPVDPNLEIAEIHRRVAAAGGPAIFFHSVKGSRFPVVTNLFGSKKRVDLAFRNRPDRAISDLVSTLTGPFPPKVKSLFKLKDVIKHIPLKKTYWPKVAACQSFDLNELPLLTCWPEDGGAFVTLPLVYTQPHDGHGPANLGMYRIQRFDSKTTGLHFQIGKGGGFHYYRAELASCPLPVSIFIGGPPALILSAICPLPENVYELLLTGILQGSRLSVGKGKNHPNPLISECEFALTGYAKPHVRRLEGPFGDHYGYYSLAHEFPVFDLQTLYHKKGAIYPATVVGKPMQEDGYIGEYLQTLLSPIFPVVMPGVVDLWSYAASGFHSLSAAVIKERYHKESMTHAFRILGEGQLALTKFLLLTDQRVDLKDFKLLLTTILERCQPQTDLFIFSHLSMDTLDYTGPALNRGSRGILLGVGPAIRRLPTAWQKPLPSGVKDLKVYCPGCLVIEGEPSDLSIFESWPLVVRVDQAHQATVSDTAFLWTVFTRFDPATDIKSGHTTVVHNHICHHFPIFIDARMKPSYPKVVETDPDTNKKVSDNWSAYFETPVQMGDSHKAHLS